jgi:hypothetical protein
MVANLILFPLLSREFYFVNLFVNINTIVRNCLDKTIYEYKKKELAQAFIDGDLIAQLISLQNASRTTGISKTCTSSCSYFIYTLAWMVCIILKKSKVQLIYKVKLL